MASTWQGFEEADKVRRAARKWRGQDSGIMVEPGIENPDDVLADRSDNTVKASVLMDDAAQLVILIPAWNLTDPADGKDQLQVHHKIGGLTHQIGGGEFSAGEASVFPLRITLLKETENYGANGLHGFEYTIRKFNGQTSTSSRLNLIFDRVAPNQGHPPGEVPPIAEVTDANVATVSIVLPDYSDRAVKDHVYYYWLKEVPEDFTGVTPAGHAEVTAADQSLSVPEAVIKAVGDGEVFVVYLLVDKAGNIGHVSKPRSVVVALGAMPANLLPPSVPLAVDGLVDRADAKQGVQVLVPQFDNWKPSDQVRVTWGSAQLSAREIGEGEDFPLVFSVGRDVLRTTYGTPAVGTKALDVRYDVLRGGVSRGDAQITVNVNFETFGPVDPGPDPDPQWPDPVNQRLPVCQVFGDGSTTPNELLPEHDGKPAALRVELYEGLAEDDLIQFFWGAEHITEADYRVSATDVEGDPLERQLPWSYIHKTGNGSVLVRYELTRAGVPNKPVSKDTTVAVSAIVVHPDAPQFEGVNTDDWLACTSLSDPDNPSADPAVRITVGDLTQYGLKEGDTVTVFWWMLHRQADDPDNQDELVLDQPLQKEITLGEDFPATGFTWRVEPYEDWILPLFEFHQTVHSGRALSRYEFEDPIKRRRGLHTLVVSDTAEQRIAMEDAFGPCPVFFYRR